MPIIGSAVSIRSFGGIGGSSGAAGGGEEVFTTPGITSWTAPAGVTTVHVVAVGAGGRGGSAPGSITYGYAGGGGGGGLAYRNNIQVTPGQSYTVVVGSGSGGSGGKDSAFINEQTVAGYGGQDGASRALNESGLKAGGTGGEFNGLGGGNGGRGGDSTGGQYHSPGGGGGAGGYTGAGGRGGDTGNVLWTAAGQSTAYGGGGGAAGPYGGSYAGGGGGVGLEGPSGYNSTANGGEYDSNNYPYLVAKGGAGGADATAWPNGGGGLYGGGAAGGYHNEGVRSGASGAVRIVWGVTNPFNHSYTSYTGGEYYSASAITHGQWRTVGTSTTSNTQLWIRQQTIGGQSQNALAVNIRNALNDKTVGDTITVGQPFSPTKTFTISGGISSQVGYFGSSDYTSWFFDVDSQGLSSDSFFYEFTIQG